MIARPQMNERGSAAVEAALLIPAMGALVLVVVFGGRIAVARQAVQSAAADAARAASISRTADAALLSATRIATAALATQGLTCTSSSIDVDTSGFARPPGTPAMTSVTVICDVLTADLSLPAPGTIRVEASMDSPLDTYRGRR